VNFSGFTRLPASLSKTGRGLSAHVPASKPGLNGLNEGKASILVARQTGPKLNFNPTPHARSRFHH